MECCGPRSPGDRRSGQHNRSSILKRLAGERGSISYGELLVAAAMGLIILTAVFLLYNVSVHGQDRTHQRVRQLAQQQNGVERMQRDLRQATSIIPVNSQVVDMTTYVSSAQLKVRYDCTGGSCRRFTASSPNGDLNAATAFTTVVSDVQNANVFTMEPDYINPNLVVVEVDVGVKGATRPITLKGGVALKNLSRES